VVAIDVDDAGLVYLKGRNVRRVHRGEDGKLLIGAILYQDPKIQAFAAGVGDVSVRDHTILAPDKDSTYRLQAISSSTAAGDSDLLFSKVGLFQLHNDDVEWSFVVGNLSEHAMGEEFVVV